MTDDDYIIREAVDDVTSRPAERAEQEREQAFHAGYSWRGKTFEGLSCSKKMLCDALCYKAGFPPLKAGFDDLQWFAPMSKAIVFVCATPSDRLRKLWSLGIDAVLDAFTTWVDANVRISEEAAIVQLGQQILIDSNKNQAEALPTAGGSGK
jgi:hypothetical protein